MATLPQHRGAARVRRPARAAVAPCAVHVPERQGPAHHHRSVSAVTAVQGGRQGSGALGFTPYLVRAVAAGSRVMPPS